MSWDWGSFTGGVVSAAIGIAAIITGYVIARHNARLAEDSASSAARSADAAQRLVELEIERDKIDLEVTAGEEIEAGVTIVYVRISNHGKDVCLDRVGLRLPGDGELDFDNHNVFEPASTGTPGWLPNGGGNRQARKIGTLRRAARELGLSGEVEIKGFCTLATKQQFESDPFKVDLGTSPEE